MTTGHVSFSPSPTPGRCGVGMASLAANTSAERDAALLLEELEPAWHLRLF